jgi:integrase
VKKLVQLWKRPTYDGKRYTFYLIYYDTDGRRRQKALRHTDKRKAERQRAQFERELRMGTLEPESMRLSDFLEDGLARMRGQVRESTIGETRTAMRDFIRVIGNIDCQKVQHRHGERFVQTCMDRGNTPATATKKLRHLHGFFQRAVNRGQLEENAFKRVPKPKVPRKPVRIYSDAECHRLMKASQEHHCRLLVQWSLLFRLAMCTGMRRGELLNTTWRDIDFEQKTIEVSPKLDTAHTWVWYIKDSDRRTLPLTDELTRQLAQHQAEQPDGYPYVFVPPVRYDRIQARRHQGTWTEEDGRCPLNNFTDHFKAIRHKAAIDEGQFHDLRRTCLKNLLDHGLTEYEVMKLAGHSSFETTHRFYLAVSDSLLQRAREASTRATEGKIVAKLLQVPFKVQSDRSS